MAFSEICRVYQQGEKFLVLNPSVPAWIVTNINGVLLLKLYAEEKTFAEIAAEFQTYAPDFPVSAMINFLEEAATEHLFDAPTELAEYAPSDLRNVYLNVTDTCNLNCIYCVNSLREESAKNLRLDDYKRLIDEIAAMNPKIGVIFTGGEALTSSITIPAAEYAKTRGLDFQPLFPFANPKLYDALKISGKDYFDAMTRASDNVIFHEFITKIPEHYRTKKTQIKCGLGDGQISISHSGDVYPCALLHNPLFKIP